MKDAWVVYKRRMRRFNFSLKKNLNSFSSACSEKGMKSESKANRTSRRTSYLSKGSASLADECFEGLSGVKM